MNKLEEIIAYKKKEVAQRKSYRSIKELENSIFFETVPISLSQALRRNGETGIIAEIKRKSPSKGLINPEVSVEKISIGYVKAGASALSVLTDQKYFGGSNEDLMSVRRLCACPILRKEFIIDEYQIVEAKSIGADAILLIAAVLDADEVRSLTTFAHQLGMEVLLEVHNEEELKMNPLADVDLIGVNNRDLTTFEVDVKTSLKLLELIPKEMSKISESGITSPSIAMELISTGFDGLLIGEMFMKSHQPEVAATEFIGELKRLKAEAHARH